MPRFAIVMRGAAGAWERLPAGEQERLLALYGTFARNLRTRGALVDAQALGPGGRLLHTVGDEVQATDLDDAAAVDAADVATGWFLVEAPDLDAATSLARGCPALLHGETVVVRPVGGGS
jgi:hypothetical protein